MFEFQEKLSTGQIVGSLSSIYSESDKKIDVYAFAVTIYEVVSGKTMFHELPNASEMVSAIRHGLRPTEPLKFANVKSLNFIIKNGWLQDQRKRPTIDEVVLSLEEDLNKPSY